MPESAAPALSATTGASGTLTAEAMLEHWQGHRRLTRRTIVAFPEDQLFSFSVGGMRPFGTLAMEMLGMGAPFVRGIVTDMWEPYADQKAASRDELLALWDKATAEISSQWSQIPRQRFSETIKAFGQYEGRVTDLVLYVIDNEVHHRGQGYVYLRVLGIEPPPFWERE